MAEQILIRDRESASLDGSAFGEEVAVRTASLMTAAAASDDELQALGRRGIAEVAARAEALMASGVDRALAVAWLQSAADAFSSELDRTVGALLRHDPGG